MGIHMGKKKYYTFGDNNLPLNEYTFADLYTLSNAFTYIDEVTNTELELMEISSSGLT